MKKNNLQKKKGFSRRKMMAVGAGVAALGAGAYYLLGPDGKKHQKNAKALFVKMKNEVVKDVKKLRNVTAPLYNNAVDEVSASYSRQYKAHGAEIKAFAKKLKNDWKKMAKSSARRKRRG